MELWRFMEIHQWWKNFPDVWCSTTRNQITKRHGHVSWSFHIWKIPHPQAVFFASETPPKKNALRKELAQQVLYQIQIARNQSHTSCLQILFQIWIEARLGEGSSVKICKRSYFQDSLCVDSYWSVDVRNWEFLPQLQTYKLCTSGLRPHQGLNFRFLNSWWETLGRVTEERLDS